MGIKYLEILAAAAVTLAVSFGLFIQDCQGSSSAPERPEPLVKKVDHVVILSNDPRQLFKLLTETLGLPIAWPFTEYPGFASGGVQMGNVNIETIHFDKDSKPLYPGAPPLYREGSRASLFGIVLEPYPLAAITGELQSRGASPGAPSDMMGEYGGRPVKLWTSVFLEALGLDSYIVYLCEYSTGYREMLGKHAVQPPLGDIGLLSVREITVGAKDLQATQKAWDKFLAPVRRAEGRYAIGNGPALRLAEAGENRIISLVLEVASLQKARAFLEGKGLLGEASQDQIAVDPSRVQALDIRLIEGR